MFGNLKNFLVNLKIAFEPIMIINGNVLEKIIANIRVSCEIGRGDFVGISFLQTACEISIARATSIGCSNMPFRRWWQDTNTS